MKILLIASLILNAVLIYFYYQEKSQPKIERIIMEQHEKPSVKTKSHVPENFRPALVPKKIKKDPSEEADSEHPFVGDIVSFERTVEDMDAVKKDFLEKTEIPEQFDTEKAKILGAYYERSSAFYKKHPTGMSMNFGEKRKLIDMEEEAHRKIEKVYGKEKWEKYKSFVDAYNKKLLEGYMTGDYMGPLMGY